MEQFPIAALVKDCWCLYKLLGYSLVGDWGEPNAALFVLLPLTPPQNWYHRQAVILDKRLTINEILY